MSIIRRAHEMTLQYRREGRLELPNNTVLVMHPLDGSPDPVVEYGIGRVSHRERIYNGNEPWSRAWVVRRVLEALKWEEKEAAKAAAAGGALVVFPF